MTLVVGVSNVGGHVLAPAGSVHGAHLSLGVSILQEDVGVDEPAGSTAVEVLLVVGSGLLAVTNASCWVKVVLVDLLVNAVLNESWAFVGRSVDGGVAQVLALVAGDVEGGCRGKGGHAGESEGGTHLGGDTDG